jgi:O-antigen ligase
LLTFFLPLMAYVLAFPVMLVTIRRVEVGLLYFITLVPIIAVMTKISTFPGGHNIADYLLIAIVVGALAAASRENRKALPASPLNGAVAILVVGSVINLVRGYTFMDFPHEIGLERLMTWKNYMILPVLYFVGFSTVRSEKNVKWVIVCVSLMLLACTFNFYSTFRWFKAAHYSNDIRISGPFSFLGPNEMGVFFAMYTFLLLGISFYVENRKLRYLLLLVSAVNCYPILYSFSRAAYLSFLVGLLVLALVKERRFILVLIGLVAFYSVVLPTAVVERIDQTFLQKDEVSEDYWDRRAMDIGGVTVDSTGRKQLWNKAGDYFREHPILGIGFDTFRYKEGYITHSMYYKILAEQGLVGVIIHLIFYGVIIRQSYRLFRRSPGGIGKGVGLGFFLATFVHLAGNLTGDQSLYYNLMAVFWLFLGIVSRFSVDYLEDGVKKNRVMA